MPFTLKTLPSFVKKYSSNIQRQWLHVWSTVFKKTKNEIRAFKAANSILKKRFKKKLSMEQNTRDDYFSSLVDDWLGNLYS